KYSISNKTVLIQKKPSVKNVIEFREFVAQPVEIRGRVIDEKGQPLSAVTIQLIKGENQSTLTGANGEFFLPIKEFPTALRISALGYETQELIINNANVIEIVLKEVTSALEEVVVMAY